MGTRQLAQILYHALVKEMNL